MNQIGLTKENFFDAMSEKYPNAMQRFNDFIDKYKTSVNWNELFNDEESYTGTPGNAPKFHEIPYELQVGVIMLFIRENVSFMPMIVDYGSLKKAFEVCLRTIQNGY